MVLKKQAAKVREIQIFSPENPSYDELNKPLGTKRAMNDSRAFFNEILESYNTSAIGTILVFPKRDGQTLGNFHRVMDGRGLIREEDYQTSTVMHDMDGNKFSVSDRPMKIKKLSDKKGKISKTAD